MSSRIKFLSNLLLVRWSQAVFLILQPRTLSILLFYCFIYYNYTSYSSKISFLYEITILVILVLTSTDWFQCTTLFFSSKAYAFTLIFFSSLCLTWFSNNSLSFPSTSFSTIDRRPVVSTLTCSGTPLWYNRVAELRLWEWFVKFPSNPAFVVISLLHFLTFLFALG